VTLVLTANHRSLGFDAARGGPQDFAAPAARETDQRAKPMHERKITAE
jgi:hypothetical protein